VTWKPNRRGMTEIAVPAPVAAALAEIGRFAAVRGWVPATSGNFSCRIDAGHAAVTRSGIDKGNIRPEDCIAVSLEGALPPGVSAETPLHVARYRNDARAGAVVHVHTVAATVLSRADARRGYVELEGFEMHKSLRGVTTHESVVRLPIFANDQDTTRLAEQIEARLEGAAAPGYLLAGHGLYAWGATAADARRHLEGLEFLLQCALEERRLR
jgi:methylthioribulose-1-phosphate dehydratase